MRRRSVLGGIWWFMLLAWVPAASAADPVAVSVDCSRPVEGPLHLWGHVNVSRRAPPPVELCKRVETEYGRPQVTRCWLMLDQMWDYRTDSYRFDYEINKEYYADDPDKKRYGVPGVATGLHYYDYLDSVSRHSDAVMINIRRYEREVLTGMLSFDQWKEVFKAGVRHYKLRCPNVEYIEVLNEPTARNQSNLGKITHYYDFYRRAYEAINELNAELQPERPLRVGGNSGFRTGEAIHLIRDFARDANPAKKLDFVSFHHYWINDQPAAIAGWEAEIDRALADASLPTDVPIFVTEIGYTLKWRTDPQRNLWQAAGMTAYQFYARRSADLRLFPWVQYHSDQQIALVQFDPRMRMTPYGAAVKMLRMHRGREVAAESSGLEANGNGLGVLATQDDAGLTVQLWNLDPQDGGPLKADVAIRGIPAAWHSRPLVVRRYLIDRDHSNCLSAGNGSGDLEMVERSRLEGGPALGLSAALQPMAVCLWQVEPDR